MTPTLFTVAETSALLRVSARTVRRLIEKRQLVAHQFGRSIRVDASSVTRLLEETATCLKTGDESTSEVHPTSSGSAEGGRSGTGSSRAARSASKRQTPPPPTAGFSSWPKNSAQLREHLRRLRRPS
ncbi:MAG: helix-turn-helix domain-containing protein [Myxococcales bacterium]|nr:helix-turn-helix domain-containing protein [Myxococcales bacterium]